MIHEKDAGASAPMFAVVVPDDEDQRARAITVLHEARDGTIWVGTRKGLHRVEHANGRVSLRSIEIGLPNDFPEQREIFDVLEDGAAPCGSRHPAVCIAGGLTASRQIHDTRWAPSDHLFDLLEDHKGQLWAGTIGFGFFRFRADRSRTPPLVDLSMSMKMAFRPNGCLTVRDRGPPILGCDEHGPNRVSAGQRWPRALPFLR